jgi:hypothetical protein
MGHWEKLVRNGLKRFPGETQSESKRLTAKQGEYELVKGFFERFAFAQWLRGKRNRSNLSSKDTGRRNRKSAERFADEFDIAGSI